MRESRGRAVFGVSVARIARMRMGLLAALAVAHPALAGNADAGADAGADAAAVEADMKAITVTATRTPLTLLEAPATVTVFDADAIADQMVSDIRDLVRFEPGVSVRRAPSRFGMAQGSSGRDGNAGFNIRGLEGNRVLIQVLW